MCKEVRQQCFTSSVVTQQRFKSEANDEGKSGPRGEGNVKSFFASFFLNVTSIVTLLM